MNDQKNKIDTQLENDNQEKEIEIKENTNNIFIKFIKKEKELLIPLIMVILIVSIKYIIYGKTIIEAFRLMEFHKYYMIFFVPLYILLLIVKQYIDNKYFLKTIKIILWIILLLALIYTL